MNRIVPIFRTPRYNFLLMYTTIICFIKKRDDKILSSRFFMKQIIVVYINKKLYLGVRKIGTMRFMRIIWFLFYELTALKSKI